uniref:Acyl-ACP thioesterase-like C-terminal domain-containing protein n=1 Tax=Branchiostoma floridae TaxID=7739 RepID=C3Z046_BRAFL|eukprot:XP_002598093.1 hypothetical protein BRAFLDRAFT_85690 [Branchiostoma floridae]
MFLRMLEFARIAAIRPLIKEHTGPQNDRATAFVRYQEAEFAPRFYAIVKPDSSLMMSTYLGYVGRSSLFYNYDIRSSTSNNIIGRSSTQMVRVNRQTRRPIAWPDALIENLRHLKLWILAAIIDSNQLAILSGDKARLRIPGLLETVTGFARYQEFRIEPAFYTKLRAGDRVTSTMSVSHVGRTSWLLEGDLRLTSTGEVLCYSLGQGVLVNIVTRKPTAVPDNLRKLFPKKDPLPQLEVPTPLDPGKTCRHNFVALPSDSDMNEHTNFATYIRFCLDATAASVRKGAFPFLNKGQPKVKKISLLFQNETKEGENVTVEAAEDLVRNVTPWKLALLIGYARLAAITEKSVFLLPGYLKTITSFLRYQEFLLEPAFYTDVKPRSFVVVTVGVGHVGRTSYELKGDVQLAGSGAVLCRFSVMSVVVDISTRRPVPLPETLRRRGHGPRPESCLPFASALPATHSQRFDVRESDLDFNGHTNQSNYIRFCCDAAASAVKSGRYPSLKRDLLSYRLKKIAMLYENEALLGDPLQVESWEIPSKPVSLGFKVTRGNDDVIQGLFELYGEHAQKAKL